MEVKLFESIEEAKRVLQENIPRLVQVHGRNVCIIRRGALLTAFVNECPHLGESLHRGMVNYRNEIVCPLHSYRFDLRSGEETYHRCSSLKFVKIVERSGIIYLKI